MGSINGVLMMSGAGVSAASGTLTCPFFSKRHADNRPDGVFG
jgi:NAD-dependent SIR2 family protein deacetylase